MVPIEDELFVAIEWNGGKNYLREPGGGGRGAHSTCPDAAVRFQRADGEHEIVLIEWKYTETYRVESKVVSERGTDRRRIYESFFRGEGCPICRDTLPAYDDLFFEPFYQLFREQLLAKEMEDDSALGVERACLCHIAPSQHVAGERVTSPSLRQLGESVTEVWRRLVCVPGRFVSVATETLFPERAPAGMEDWWRYISERYPWLLRES